MQAGKLCQKISFKRPTKLRVQLGWIIKGESYLSIDSWYSLEACKYVVIEDEPSLGRALSIFVQVYSC